MSRGKSASFRRELVQISARIPFQDRGLADSNGSSDTGRGVLMWVRLNPGTGLGLVRWGMLGKPGGGLVRGVVDRIN